MKIITGIILGIIILTLITIGIIALINNNNSNQAAQVTPTISITQPTIITPTTSITQPSLSQPVNPQPSTSTSTINPTSSGLPSGAANVNFVLQITGVSETGTLSRSITGEITNTGSVDAHNVVGKIEVYSNGKLIKINNGQSYLSITLGTIKAGETVTTKVDLSFGLFDAVTLTQNGATINLQISSDEKTQVLTYDYKP